MDVFQQTTCADLNFNRASQATVLRIYYGVARAESGGPGKKFSWMFRTEMLVAQRGASDGSNGEKWLDSGYILKADPNVKRVH